MTARIVLVALLALALTDDARAQDVRGSATTTLRYINMRPMVQDTINRNLVTQLPDGRYEFEGRPVSCVAELPCIYFRSLDVEHAVVATQDLSLTGWGFGVQGLSVTAMLRARADVAGELVWPQSNDNFDAILAYAELNRQTWRARVGRQRTIAGLGFAGFDGASAQVYPLEWLRLEAFGGRSLARGLNEPRNEALQGIEDFVLDRQAWVMGASARADIGNRTAVNAHYQRDIFAGRSGLVSERASVDVSTSQFRPLMLDAAADYDFAFGRIGKAHATLRAPLRDGALTLEATARRYLPYFELWTIWGYFSPVAYHEAEARATWRARPNALLWTSAGYRRYDEANATVVLRPLTDEGVRASIGAQWQVHPSLQLNGSYRTERGFGAFLSSGDASATWQATERLALSADATAFQQIEEFRLGEGVVYGAGASADVELPRGLMLSSGATMYRQHFENRPGTADWNQLRAFTMLRAGFGRDPGMRPRPRSAP